MIQQLNEEQQKAFKLYGKLPAKNALTKMQKVTYPSGVGMAVPTWASLTPAFFIM
jgi:hypothetical protein